MRRSAATARTARRIALTALAVALTLGSAGCARRATTRSAEPTSTPAPVSAVRTASRYDSQQAGKVALKYVAALRSQNATAAAMFMTAYRRAETRAPGWAASVKQWKTARVTSVSAPGKYVSDERTFAQLYADRVGKPPYELVVVNVSYLYGATSRRGDTDFVLTKATPISPWLIDDFGGAPASGN